MTLPNIDVHYFFPGYTGLGGIIRVMMDDAGIAYNFHHHNAKVDFPEIKAQWIASGHPFDCVPMIELGSKRYSGCLPILRFLSKKIGKYTPADPELEQYVDATGDYGMDWLRTFVMAYHNDTLEEYKKNEKEKFFKRFDRIYGVHKGPYVVGEEISYSDFLVHYIMSIEKNSDAIKDYPNLLTLYEAIRARPNIQEAMNQAKVIRTLGH